MSSETKYFTEIGFGNDSFISTEIEKGDTEYRVRGFVKMRIVSIYLRLWLGKKVFILSSNEGFLITHKTRNKIKVLLGFQGK